MIDQSKYLSKEEKEILSKNIKHQIESLKKDLNDKSKFIKKKGLENVTYMEEGEDSDE